MATAADNLYICAQGMRFPNRPDILPNHNLEALRQGKFERWERQAVMAIAQTTDHVLELGGGLGFLSSLLSLQSQVQSVTTLEPNPDLADYIATVHQLNNVQNATVLQAVAGPDDLPQIPFHIRDNVLASSLDAETGAKPIRTIATKAIDINTLIDKKQINYLICDIEGGEADLTEFLNPDPLRAITLELHPQKIGSEAIRDIFEKLHQNGLIYAPEASFSKVVSFVRDPRLS